MQNALHPSEDQYSSTLIQIKSHQDGINPTQINNNQYNENTILIPQEPTSQLIKHQEKKIVDDIPNLTDAEQIKNLPQQQKKIDKNQNKFEYISNNNKQQQDLLKQIQIQDKIPVQKSVSIKKQTTNENQHIYQETYYNPIQGQQPQNYQGINYQINIRNIRRKSSHQTCEYCQNPLELIEDHKINGNTICCGVIIALCLSPLCCWIPCVLDSCKDTVLVCAACGETINIVKEYEICLMIQKL